MSRLLLLVFHGNAIARCRRRGLATLLSIFSSLIRLVRLLMASVVVVVRQVLMSQLFDEEEHDDADDNHETRLVIIVIVMAMILMAVLLTMCKFIRLFQFWQRVKEHVSKQAANGKRDPILHCSVLCILSTEAAERDVYRIDKEYRHNRNEDGRHDGLRPGRHWSENLLQSLHKYVGFKVPNDCFYELLLIITAIIVGVGLINLFLWEYHIL